MANQNFLLLQFFKITIMFMNDLNKVIKKSDHCIHLLYFELVCELQDASKAIVISKTENHHVISDNNHSSFFLLSLSRLKYMW